ncbi:MucBP domain-containing protein [Enterococcus rotai]|uniref:MucBP domain-containing protein n=1 Tax=Enterococcus rotai TaxID=118060 RepID=UPI0035C6E481
MKNKKKMKSWFTVGLLFLGIGLISWLFLPSSSIKANPTTNELAATAKQLILSQNEEFPDLTTKSGLEKLFDKESLPESTKDFSYEYSNDKGKTKETSSANVGYQQLYVKMTNKRTKKSKVIPVPVTIKNGGTTLLAENQIALQLDSGEGYIQFQAKEAENKTAEEVQQLVTEKAKARAWRTDTGKELPVTVSKTTIDAAKVGNYKATFDIALDEQKQAIQTEKEVLVQENTRMLNPSPRTEEATTDWELIPQGEHTQFVNQKFNDPDTPSGILLNNGIPGNIYSYMRDKRELYRFPLKFGYSLKAGVGSLFGNTVGMPTIVPFQNGTPLTSVAEQDRVGKVYVKKSISNPKEIVRVKTEASDKYLNPDIKFIYEMWIAPNQSFRVQMSIQNIGNSTMNLGFVNKGEVSSGGMTNVQPFQVRSLGNGRGVHGLFGKDAAGGQSEFSIDFKPRVDDPYTYWDIRPDKKQGDDDRNEEWKALTYSGLKPGMEENKVKPGEVLFPDKLLSYIYTAGVPERPVAPGESVSATWDIYFGVALPYISIDAEPEEYNVYQDTKKQEFNYNYTLGKMPLDSSYGTLTVTYPDKSDEKKPFSAVNNTGSVTVPRTKLPEQLNNNPGTIETYTTSLFGINEDPAGQPGLPTEDKYLNVNVYNLGATPIPQVVAKDSTWNKTAESLIKNPVYLPGNTVTTNYVKTKPIDTSKVGLQLVEVIMTDKTEQPNKTAIIKVPVMVIDGEIPKDFVFGVKDFSVDKSEIANLTDDQLKKLIIEKSNATAWDVITGLSDDIKFSVVKKTLETTSEASKTPYTARISAEKDGVQKEETVNITVTAKSNLTVQFVDEDNLPIETPVTLEKNVGDTVNLREEEGIKQLLEKQKERGYVELAKPEKDTSYPIANKDETVTYQFKTKSKLTVEFVNENDTVLNSVELNKKIGSKVDLTVEDSIQKLVSKYKAMNYTLLESPTPEDAYPNTLDDKQTVRYKYQTSSKLTVQFVDENNKILDSKDTVELQKEIGVPVDLTQEKTVQDIVNKYKGMNYTLLETPTPENAYPITADDQTITYKFQTNSKLIINFVNEKNEQLKTLELDKEVGKPVNLSKEQSIVDTLAELDKENHVLEKRPDNEANYPVGATNAPVTYYFRSYATLVVEFLNASISNEDVLREPLRLEKRIGTVFDFIEDSEIATIIDGFMDKGYGIAGYRPESPYTITRDAEQQIEFQIALDGEIPVEFVDEKNTIIKKFEMVRDIGKLDLSEDRDILDAIKELQAQNYEVIERPVNEKTYQVKMHNDKVVYKVKKTEVALKIRFVDEEGKDIPSVESINSTAIIGSTLDLTQYETEIQERLTQLKDEHYELVESPVDNQEIKGPLELFYRFKGSLFISSYPETLDFRDKYMTSKVIQAEQPRYDKDLIVKDTRKNNKGAWQLSATLETPLTSKENPSEIINNVFFYKQNATTKVPLLTGQAQPIETGVATTVEEEYNISKKWTENKTGLELIVHSNKIFQTGKYGASILWQVESTP